VSDDHFALDPDRVEWLLANDPDNPLFNAVDADDPEAGVLSFDHLRKGLVRVTLPLPDNMDVIDEHGTVITPQDRKISVWRGVPSVLNVAYDAPYQSDGRLSTLEEQAQAAFLAHSAAGAQPQSQLEQLADFERTLFSSDAARDVARWSSLSALDATLERPEDRAALDAAEMRGLTVFNSACEACHGGATTKQIVNRQVQGVFFNALKPDGNVLWQPIVLPGATPFSIPVQDPRPFDEFLNAGFAYMSYLGQIGRAPKLFNASVSLPRYRFRFYKDSARTQQLTDLPPIPVTASGDPLDPNAALDEYNGLIAGPNFFAQQFTTDPGRALISGDPLDFEGFDVPQLRGVAKTAPYLHDNSHLTLEEVLDSYSRRVLPFLLPLNLPAQYPPETPGGEKEALTPQQKQDLLAYLRLL
jgi:mono/diheme cytochrome c family protein